MAISYMPTADTNKDGTISEKELRKWNKAGRPVDDVDVEAMAASQGYAASILKKFPELTDVLRGILKEGIVDPALIAGRITSSDWFKSYLPSYLEVEKQRQAMSPDIWNARVKAAAEKIKVQFIDAGANIDDATALKYAEQMIYGSTGDVRTEDFEEFDQDWLQETISDAIDFTKTKEVNGVKFYDLSGKAEETAQALYKAAYDYGVDSSMSNASFTNWFESSVRRVLDGDAAVQDVDDELVDMAISRFPGLASQLQRGLTLRDAADPYLKAISDVLEYDAGTFDLNDDLVQRVLNNVDESGNFKPMSLYDAKLAARRDPRWQYTSKAKTEYTDIASDILKDFGFLG